MDRPQNVKSSKVIDQLHLQIDELKQELELVKLSADEYKKKYTLVMQKNDLTLDQMANLKHENDMINALLKRKERRIIDLEDSFNELNLNNELLQLANKNMKIRCENLQESTAALTADHERLKIAYDALLASQNEYKKHYQKEFNDLAQQFENFKKEQEHRYGSLNQKYADNDKDIDALLESLTNKRKTMDNLYVNKNKAVVELLSKLAHIARIHGQESKLVLEENVQVIKDVLAKYPDLKEKIALHEKVEVDLDSLLLESQETLVNCSFDEEVSELDEIKRTLVESTVLGGNTNTANKRNLIQSKRRKSKRALMRFDGKLAPDFSHINTPQLTPLSLPKRPNLSNNPGRVVLGNNHGRTPTPPGDDYGYKGNQNGWNPGHHHSQLYSMSNSNMGNRLFSNLSRHSRQTLLLMAQNSNYQFGASNQFGQNAGYQNQYQNNGYQGNYQNNGYQSNGYQNNGYQNNGYQNNQRNNNASKRRSMSHYNNKRVSSANFDMSQMNFALNQN